MEFKTDFVRRLRLFLKFLSSWRLIFPADKISVVSAPYCAYNLGTIHELNKRDNTNKRLES